MKKWLALAAIVASVSMNAGPCANGICRGGDGKIWMYNCKMNRSTSTKNPEHAEIFIKASDGLVMSDYKNVDSVGTYETGAYVANLGPC